MDFYALQKKLFEMDPTDPRDDLRKLQEQAQRSKNIEPTINYLEETVQVNKGSLPLPGLDLDSFARLAGVQLDEKQKTGSAGQAKGSDPMPKAEPGRTKHPLKDKLVGEDEIDEAGSIDALKHGFKNYNNPSGVFGAAGKVNSELPEPKSTSGATQQTQKTKGNISGAQLAKQLGLSDPQNFLLAIQKVKQGQPINRLHQAAFSEAFQKLMAMNPEDTQRIMMMLKRMEATEAEKKPMPKPRDPSSQYMQNLRKSGAMGAHKDKKKDAKSGQFKHKGQQYESIKDMLYAKLSEKK